ncbi:DUF3105 domain-containing protein [Microbacterium sp. CFH 90308]|uniref:DUF3105 domain-containing protein n=1 Tax=Microbacterium salsuginis TaxID=2722803 RepID=A0ABX1K7B4_9MICO|nr:DUF3105 domain-containing protein [Microbacterium sp. CFH 90308]NLP82904.1 DUF3105 domain-containing protein [Microbacterium sp. CFH 90308]
MTPADKRNSGNPATQAQINLTVKQQREQKRQEKLAEYQRQLAKRRRSKLVWWIVGSTAAIVIIGLIVASIVFAPPPPKEYEAGSDGVEIEGVETFENTTEHVDGEVDYEQSPPAGGPHNAMWLNCGIYDQPVPNENAVHSMEHGAIWVTYDADALSDDELSTLRAELPSSYVVLSPYEGLDSPIVLSAWNHQLKLDSADDERVGQFFEEYWRSQNVPEPNASCSGALDAPGKQ